MSYAYQYIITENLKTTFLEIFFKILILKLVYKILNGRLFFSNEFSLENKFQNLS